MLKFLFFFASKHISQIPGRSGGGKCIKIRQKIFARTRKLTIENMEKGSHNLTTSQFILCHKITM